MSTKNVLYEEVEKIKNNETGEIIEERNRKLVKKNNTPDFIMLFTQTSPQLFEAKLTSAQNSVLFSILTGQRVYRSNVVDLSSVARIEIEQATNLTRNTINQCISRLVKKDIILREQVGKNTYKYMLNPYVFGKGNWADIEKLRYEVDITYDFKKLEVTHKEQTSSNYEGLNEISYKPHSIVSQNEHIDNKGVINQEIEVQEDKYVDEQNSNHKQLHFDINKNEKNFDNDIELLREKNKYKELKIKEIETRIRAKELGIDLDIDD